MFFKFVRVIERAKMTEQKKKFEKSEKRFGNVENCF